MGPRPRQLVADEYAFDVQGLRRRVQADQELPEGWHREGEKPRITTTQIDRVPTAKKLASTAPWMPNWYALRRECDEGEFVWFLDFISSSAGYDRSWGRSVYRSLDLDGWTYWRQEKYDAVLVHRARPEAEPPQLRLAVEDTP